MKAAFSYRRGVAQPGSAPALGAGGPRFKSARPDHSTSHAQLFQPHFKIAHLPWRSMFENCPSFRKFIHERKSLSNVSPAIVEWYQQSLWLCDNQPLWGLEKTIRSDSAN
jgi:hypothetical protein